MAGWIFVIGFVVRSAWSLVNWWLDTPVVDDATYDRMRQAMEEEDRKRYCA